MTRFKKIVAVDETLLNEEALQQLQKLGEKVVVYHDFPQDEHITATEQAATINPILHIIFFIIFLLAETKVTKIH